MIYLDNAATSWPKPPGVLDAISHVLERAGGNPGRSGHRMSIEAARVIYNCRADLAAFFNLPDPLRVVFTPNATQGINLVLKGLLRPGDRVVTTSMEHNAIMRPLRDLEKAGIELCIIPCLPDGTLPEERLSGAIDSRTRLVAAAQAGNVIGGILPVEKVTALAHQQGALVLIDAAQSAGVLPIDIIRQGIDFVAFTGHKELLGPTGSGGLLIHPEVEIARLAPLVQGGTGSRSESEYQPEDLPDKYEAGTANLIGIAGLHAGLQFVRQIGLESIRAHALKMTNLLLEGLSVIPGVKVYGPGNPQRSVAIVSFTINGQSVSDTGFRLDEDFGILTRVGLHCAPSAHRTIGSLPEGTVRLSPGLFTSLEDIQKTLSAIQEIARQ